MVDIGLFLSLALAAFALGCQELYDADIWWHIRAGQWILANGKVARADPFTFGSADRPWIDLQWLFEVILATVFALGGVRGIVLSAAGVCTSVLLVALMARDRRWPSWVVAVCWLPALTAMSARFMPRPELLSLLGMALYLTVLRRTDTTPALAWILPLVQIFWVNVHALFVLGPVILTAYLIDRLAGTIWQPATASGPTMRGGRQRWWLHVGGAAVAVGLACLANPYGLRGVSFPMELFPKITAWGGMYKSYITEFMDLRDYVQKYSTEAAGGNLFIRANCFLLWMLPVSLIMPSVWRTCGAVESRVRGSAQVAGWLTAFAAASGLVLISVLGLPGTGAPVWLAHSAALAPLGICALGVLGAVLALAVSRWAALLALLGGSAELTWIVWLKAYLFGREPSLLAWLGVPDSFPLGHSTIFLGAVTAGLLLRAGERLFRLLLAVVFSYLALQAVRNVNFFGLAAGFVLAWSLGEWATQLADCVPVQQHRVWIWGSAGLVARVIVLVFIGIGIFMVVSGWFFRSAGGQQRFGTSESPLAYAHEAAQFAGRPGLPDHALVFSLTQAGVYLFHNGPDRKPFLDGRLEVPSQSTFETYVLLNHRLRQGGQGWSEALRRMGDPLILLDHEGNYGAEATLLLDPGWRCVYFDAIASVFLSRRYRDLEGSYPSVDFAMRHFRDRMWRTVPPEPWGLGEARALDRLALLLPFRASSGAGAIQPVRLPLRLLACDYLREALAVNSADARPWAMLGDSCWDLVADVMPVQPGPGKFWDVAQALLPAQAAFCYRRARELDPSEVGTFWVLSQAFQVQRMSDVQSSLPGLMHDRTATNLSAGSDAGAGTGADPMPVHSGANSIPSKAPQTINSNGPSQAVRALLEEGRAEAAARLLAEADERGIGAPWLIGDQVAAMLLYLGRPREARRIWEHSADPPSPALRSARIAAADLAALDYPSAERAYRGALAIDQELAEAWVGLALLHTQRGEPSDALTAAREGLRRPLTPEQRSFLRRVEALVVRHVGLQ
jgi:hypothetical protein